MSQRPLAERILEAETYAAQNLADFNAASEAGKTARAAKFHKRAQFWLDRANVLRESA